jgi:hypothetical protein
LTPTPVPTQAYPSGGLGLDRGSWELAHVPSAALGPRYTRLGEPYDGLYDVIFRDGNVWRIERRWPASEAVSLDELASLAEMLIPIDRQFQRVYTPPSEPGMTVSTYYSPSLSQRFDVSNWVYAEPGTLRAKYGTFADGTTVLVIELDDAP